MKPFLQDFSTRLRAKGVWKSTWWKLSFRNLKCPLYCSGSPSYCCSCLPSHLASAAQIPSQAGVLWYVYYWKHGLLLFTSSYSSSGISIGTSFALSCFVHNHEQWQKHDHDLHPPPRISHDHFPHYLNSACSHLLLLISHPMPALPMEQHSLTPHLKVHHTHNCTAEGWAAVTAQLSSSTLALHGWNGATLAVKLQFKPLINLSMKNTLDPLLLHFSWWRACTNSQRASTLNFLTTIS